MKKRLIEICTVLLLIIITATQSLAGEVQTDFDGDGRTDAADAAVLFRNSLKSTAQNKQEIYDVTGNNAVNRSDVKLVLLIAAQKASDPEDIIPYLKNVLIGEESMERFCYKGTVRSTDYYRSGNIAADISSVIFQNSICHVIDIVVRDPKCLRSAFSSGTYKGKRQYPAIIAKNAGAVFAITGDMYLKNAKGAFVRNGEWYEKDKGVTNKKDICVMYVDGSVEIFSKGTASVDQLESGKPIWQLWAFGPSLLDEDGEPKRNFWCSESILGNNPRSALGYYSPGHYCLVVVDGRQKPYSSGLTMEDLSDFMYQLGCSAAYNLDGGQSAVMVDGMGNMISSPSSGGRTISDIVIVAEYEAS